MNALGIKAVSLTKPGLASRRNAAYTVRLWAAGRSVACSRRRRTRGPTHPDRFSFLRRVDRRDPELKALIACMRVRRRTALRRHGPRQCRDGGAGSAGYAEMFKEAGLRLCRFCDIPGNAPALRAAAAKFRASSSSSTTAASVHPRHAECPQGRRHADDLPPWAAVPQAVRQGPELADVPNIALKWGMPRLFGFRAIRSPTFVLSPQRLDGFRIGAGMWRRRQCQMTGESWPSFCSGSWTTRTFHKRARDFLGGSARKIPVAA